MLLFSSTIGDVNIPFLSPQGIGQAPAVGNPTLIPAAFASLAVSGPITESVAAALTAGTTHTLAGATPLTGQINNIAVCANAADACALPAANAAQVGNYIIVANNGAAVGAIWPQAADKIDGGTTGVAVTLTNAKGAIFICLSVNNWISLGLPGKSS